MSDPSDGLSFGWVILWMVYSVDGLSFGWVILWMVYSVDESFRG